MSDKPSNESNEKSDTPSSKNVPAVVENDTAKAAAPAATTSGSSVAIIAALVSIVTAGGAFYLWKEVTTVQQTVANATGVEHSDLDKLQKSIEQSIAMTTDKTAAELKTTVAETKNQLEKQITDTGSKVSTEASSVRDEAKQSISDVETALVETKASIQQTRSEVENIITSTKGEIQENLNQAISSAKSEITSTQQTLAEVQGSFGELRQQVSERLKTSEEAQASLHATVQESQLELKHALSRNKVDWAVAEVEHILRLANEQVQLEQNVVKAITTLRTADQRLKSLAEEPALIKVREALEQDIASLSQVDVPDITGAALTLSRLAADARKLQTIDISKSPKADSDTAEETVAKEGEEEIETAAEIFAQNSLLAVKGFATAALEGIGGLPVIRKDDQDIAPIVPPKQAFYVRQNLQLKLENARLALLRQDNETFHDAIKTTVSWTEQYFSKDVSSTQKFIDELSALDTLNLAPTLPDISGSLKALQAVQPDL